MNASNHIFWNNPWFYKNLLWLWLIGLALLCISNDELILKWVHQHHSPLLDTTMPLITQLGEGIAVGLLLSTNFIFKKGRNAWYILAALLGSGLTSAISHLLKLALHTPRPYPVYGKREWFHHLPEWDILSHYSWPSAHTSSIFSCITLLSLTLPLSKKRWAVFFLIMAVSVAYSRMYLGAHYFSDVYFGSMVGVLCTLLIITLIEGIRNKVERKEMHQ